MNIKKAYRCGGGTKEKVVDFIAIAFENGKTEYIVDNKKDSVKKQVKEFIKNIKHER